MSDRPAATEYKALEALLQIRSNTSPSGSPNQNQSGSRVPAETANSDGSPNATQAAAAAAVVAASTNANISNFLRMSATPASILQQAHLSLASGQLAAAAASMQQSPSPINGGFGGRSLLGAVLQNHSYGSNSTGAFLSSLAQAPSMGTGMGVSQGSAATPIFPAAPNVGNSASAGTKKNGSKTPTESENIRKNEVEAALRSKPQRGRKRENLNAEERLELTRTRNREHAKSTRYEQGIFLRASFHFFRARKDLCTYIDARIS